MSIATEVSAALFLSIVAGVPLNCNFPLYDEEEIEVVYGSQALVAVYPTDYTVALSEPDFNAFTVTPTAALLAKINALIATPPTTETETNFVVVRRRLSYKTDAQPELVRGTPFLSREVDRIHMKLLQLAERVYRAVGLPATVVGDATVEYEISPPSEGKAPVWRGNKLVAEIDAANIEAAQGYAEDAAQTLIDVQAVLAQVQTIYDSFDDRYLGQKSADPVVDNDGNALIDGALYYNTVANNMRVYDLATTTWLIIDVVPDNSITTAKIVNLAVTAAKIANGAIDNALKISDGILTYAKLAAAAIASTGETVAGTANKLVSAAGLLAALPSMVSFTKSYSSAAQTISATGLLTLPHLLGVAPALMQFEIENVTGEFNYSTGDRLLVAAGRVDTARGIAVTYDATNIYVRFGSNASAFTILNKTTGVEQATTNANWKLRVKAWA